MYTISTFLCSLGAIADLDLAIRSKKINDDIMVVSQYVYKGSVYCVCTCSNIINVLCVY